MHRLDIFKLPTGFRGRSTFFVQLWWLVQSSLFMWSPQFMYGWRRFLLRCFGAEIGDGVIIRPSAKITYPWKISIDDYSWIGDDVVLYSLGEITVGKHSVVSQKSYLCTGSHKEESPAFEIYQKPIHIGDGVWIASDVFIAPGVIVGNGSIVGTRSSVFKDIPPEMVCVGSPAKVVRKRRTVSINQS